MPEYTIAGRRTRQKSLEFVKQCFRVKIQFLCKMCVSADDPSSTVPETLYKTHTYHLEVLRL